MRPLIYVCGPYTAETTAQRLDNIELARTAGKDLLAAGYASIVPHCNTGGWEHDERLDYEHFIEAGFAMIEKCVGVCVVGDWESSPGTLREIDFARSLGLSVWFGVENVPDAEWFIMLEPTQTGVQTFSST